MIAKIKASHPLALAIINPLLLAEFSEYADYSRIVRYADICGDIRR